MTTEPTGEQILAVPMGGNDADAATIREYLVELATAVWRQGEGFSGKRPFGNSDWQWDLSLALADAGMVPVTVNRWNDRVPDHDAAAALIERALDALAHPVRLNACEHDFHDMSLSPAGALIRITVSVCRKCGMPEPERRDV
jgi:hypothetical protein